MSIGVPSPDLKTTFFTLEDNLKSTIYTIKGLQKAIAEANADKVRDRSQTIESLENNLRETFAWGKLITEKIKIRDSSKIN